MQTLDPEYLKNLLETILLPIILKIITPTAITVIIGTIALGIARKTLPRKLALLVEAIIKLAGILIIAYATQYAIQSIDFSAPEFTPTFSQEDYNPYEPPTYVEDGYNPFEPAETS